MSINKLLKHLETFDVDKEIEERSVCPRCNKPKPWFAGYCSSCEEIVAAELREKKHQEYLDKLAQNSLEIRLRNIESWIYKHEQNHPIVERRMR